MSALGQERKLITSHWGLGQRPPYLNRSGIPPLGRCGATERNGNKINDDFLRLVRSRVVPHRREINDLISGAGVKVPLRRKGNLQRFPHPGPPGSGSGTWSACAISRHWSPIISALMRLSAFSLLFGAPVDFPPCIPERPFGIAVLALLESIRNDVLDPADL
jgi:hypothetical protein